jgi:capsular polysaccharide biosynthesis protein
MAVDVLAHFRELCRVLVPALVVALAAGGAVFALLSAQDPVYQANVSAWVETGSPAGSAADAQIRSTWTASAVALADDGDVLADVTSAAGVNWTRGEAADRITVVANPMSQVLSVRVLGPSPDRAAEMADQLVVVLDRRLGDAQQASVADEIGDLQREADAAQARLDQLPPTASSRAGLQRDLDAVLARIAAVREGQPLPTLTALGAATPTEAAVAPRPIETAATVALVVLLVVAELLVIFRRWWRARRSSDEPPAAPAG